MDIFGDFPHHSKLIPGFVSNQAMMTFLQSLSNSLIIDNPII
jgi:hypothetical protein